MTLIKRNWIKALKPLSPAFPVGVRKESTVYSLSGDGLSLEEALKQMAHYNDRDKGRYEYGLYEEDYNPDYYEQEKLFYED